MRWFMAIVLDTSLNDNEYAPLDLVAATPIADSTDIRANDAGAVEMCLSE